MGKVRPTAIDEGSCQNDDQVTQMRYHLQSSARPALFGHLTYLCISVMWSGPEDLQALLQPPPLKVSSEDANITLVCERAG